MTAANQLAGYASSLSSLRNLLINGAAQISQRGDVDGIVMSGATSEYTAADRWCIGKANVGENGTLDTTVTNQVLRIDTSTTNTNQQAGGGTTIRQIIEAQNCYHLSGKQVTLSFKFKTNKLGNYGVFLFGYDANAYVTPQTMTVLDTNTNSYSFTFTAPSSIANDTGEGIGVNITLWAGSNRAGTFYVSADGQADFFDSTNNYCELSQVQLEEGTVATPFEHRPYGLELSLCQRYYEKSYFGCVTSKVNANATVAPLAWNYKVPKRATPSSITVSFQDGNKTGVGPTTFNNTVSSAYAGGNGSYIWESSGDSTNTGQYTTQWIGIVETEL